MKNKTILKKSHLSHFCFFLVAGTVIVPMAYGAQVNDSTTYSVEDLNFTKPIFCVIDAEKKQYNENKEIELITSSTNDFSSMTKTELCAYKQMLLDNQNNTNKVYINISQEVEAINKALSSGNYLHAYTQEQVNLLAYAIYREAGSTWLTDRHRDLVGCVYVNRQAQGGINQTLQNPSLADIMNEPGQYPYKSWNVTTKNIPDYCVESAIRVLEGKVECPANVVYQASFKQGSGIYDKFKDSHTGVVTYFCFR